MKFKRVATLIILSFLSVLGVFWGCTNKYDNFSLQVNGDSSITLSTKKMGDFETETNVQILIKNAPNDACRIINYSVSKENIVSVTPITSNSKEVAIFKIKAIENISSYNPSCEITFKSAEGNKTCSINVNVVIPLDSISKNNAYTPYVVANDKNSEGKLNNYYINTSSLITFSPANTTQRDIIYSLKDSTLKDRYDITITEEGAISIGKIIDDSNVAIPNTITLVATSRVDETKTFEFDVRVLRAISFKDIEIGIKYDNSFSEEIKYSGERQNIENTEIENAENDESGLEEDTINLLDYTINALMEKGIILASNRDNYKNAEFNIYLKASSGLDFNSLDLTFERMFLNNAIVESLYSTNNNKTYKIFQVNPNVDYLVLKLSYKGISEYAKTITIPVVVQEYPISLVVNENNSSVYNIYDYYSNSVWGQAFNVKIEKATSFNTNFRVIISEEDFNLLDVRYKNQILDYSTLTSLIFENNTELKIKAKDILNADKVLNISFVSDILFENDILNEDLLEIGENANLIKKIKLNLLSGVKTLTYSQLFSADKNAYYLQSGESVECEFLVNGNLVEQINGISLEIIRGSELVSVVNNGAKFIIKSVGDLGEVEFKLTSENGIESQTRKLIIYNYDENYEDNLKLNLTNSNIKTVETDSGIKYFIGLSEGRNSANFSVLNPSNASIYSATVTSSNPNVITANVISQQNLTFNLFALSGSEDGVAITVKVYLYDKNENVNKGSPRLIEFTKDLTFTIFTYNPITSVSLLQDSINLVDGMVLDLDSKEKELNVLDVSSILQINKADKVNNDTVKVEYIFPSGFSELTKEGNETAYEQVLNYKNYDFTLNNDYLLADKILSNNEISPFKNIVFFVGRNHSFDSSGNLSLSFSIRIYDLIGSSDYILIPVKVILQREVQVDDIEILNENGFVYLENTQVFGQILARAISSSNKEVTNGSLIYEIEGGNSNSINLDKVTGRITIKSAGITKVTISAKSSKYTSEDEYTKQKTIYVVVADGSQTYPYILTDNNIKNSKYYTLQQNIVLDKQIEGITTGGINGKFAYSEFSNASENVVYKIISNLNNSIFTEAQIEYNLKNLDIILNSNNISINSDFGFITTKFNGVLENVNVNISSIEIKSNSDDTLSLGVLFSENYGSIINSSVTGNLSLKLNHFNFGGMVAKNYGTISGNYSFVNGFNQSYNINIAISDRVENSNILGGMVAQNYGDIENISVKAKISSLGQTLGGIIGEELNSNKTYSNLFFTGTIIGGENSLVGSIAAKVENKNNFKLIVVNLLESSNSYVLKGQIVGGLFGETNNVDVKFAYITSFVENIVDLTGEVAGGLIGVSHNETSLQAVHSEVNLSANIAGAFIGCSDNVVVLDAYTKTTGVNSYVGKINEGTTLSVNETYSRL